MPLSVICTCCSPWADCAPTVVETVTSISQKDLWAQPKAAGRWWSLYSPKRVSYPKMSRIGKCIFGVLVSGTAKATWSDSIRQQEGTPPLSVIPTPPEKSTPWARQLPTDKSSVLREAAGISTRKRKQVFVQLEWGKKQNETTNTKLSLCLNH